MLPSHRAATVISSMPLIHPVSHPGTLSMPFCTSVSRFPMLCSSPFPVPRCRHCKSTSPCWAISASSAAFCFGDRFFTNGITDAMVSPPSTAAAVGRLAACAMATPGFRVSTAPA